MKWLSTATVVALSVFSHVANGLELDIESGDSIRETAATIAFGLMRYYTGNNTGDTPGMLPDPYYWWEAGAMFGTMVDYWYLTGDDSYNDVTLQALVHQAGEDSDYNPRNHSLSMGNDDQGFWAMAAMSAAENMFPDPPEDQDQYVPLVQAVFNEYAMRWATEEDDGNCGGGLRWQVFPGNNGFDYKNTISNGCFFNVAARLGRYTGNDTYTNWAEDIWDWQDSQDLFTAEWNVLDGTRLNNETRECGNIDRIEWSYNAGIWLYGAAIMYNATEDEVWRERVDGIIENVQNMFLQDGIMFEQFCEDHRTCNNDQRTFKGYLTRWLAWTTQVAPHTYETIRPILERDAEAAASVCVGSSPTDFRGHQGTACGFRWNFEGHDGFFGVGEQMNALDAVMYLLMNEVDPPFTLENGGTSRSDPTGGVADSDRFALPPITTGDRVGAGFVTVIYLAVIIGFTSFSMLG